MDTEILKSEKNITHMFFKRFRLEVVFLTEKSGI
jgi:hypothetical protein